MNQQAAQSAIKAALNGEWNEAIEFNLQILKENPENIQALNRLGRALAAIGQTKNAKKTWNKVLKLDRYNAIATTQLEKLKSKSSKPGSSNNQSTNNPRMFLDEPGKTVTTQLVRLTDHKTIANLEPGMKVNLVAKQRFIAVNSIDGLYLGSLPDDLSINLKQLIKSGNQYSGLIRRVEKNNLHVFIKEIKRSKKNLNTPSFIVKKHTKRINLDKVSPINQTPIDITPTGEKNQYQ